MKRSLWAGGAWGRFTPLELRGTRMTGRRGLAAAIGAALVATLLVGPVPAGGAGHHDCTTTHGVTRCVIDEVVGSHFVIPAGVTEVTMEVWGAQGGGELGGRGAKVTATVAVAPGQHYLVFPGDRGTARSGTEGGRSALNGGWGGSTNVSPFVPGAAGGSSTFVRRCPDVNPGICRTGDIIVAGGGGGQAGQGVDGAESGAGGHGGQVGQPGGNGSTGPTGGGGGTATAGGLGGDSADTSPPTCRTLAVDGRDGDSDRSYDPDDDPDPGAGGDGGDGCAGGGGGGGGAHGGGGGAGGNASAGGGGGGSSAVYTDQVSEATYETGAREGNGLIVISWGERDDTPPTTTIDLAPTAPDGMAGWYLSPVTVSVTATDEGSEQIATRCVLDPGSVPASYADLPEEACDLGVVDTNGERTVYAASEDGNGNAGEVVSRTFSIDTTAPLLDASVSPDPVLLHGDATATPGASDATSGVAAASCDPVGSSVAGPNAVQCTATDIAGNTTTAEVPYTVAYAFEGFGPPVRSNGNRVTPGRSIPLKWRLTDANGAPVAGVDPAAVSVTSIPCDDPDAVAADEPSADDSGLQDLGHGSYQYDWKTSRHYTGCRTLLLDAGDGVTHTVDFHFR